MPAKLDDAKMKEAFKIIDTDGSGSLSISELERLVAACARSQGENFSPEELNEICTGLHGALDSNKDGKVTCDEFIAAMKSVQK